MFNAGFLLQSRRFMCGRCHSTLSNVHLANDVFCCCCMCSYRHAWSRCRATSWEFPWPLMWTPLAVFYSSTMIWNRVSFGCWGSLGRGFWSTFLFQARSGACRKCGGLIKGGEEEGGGWVGWCKDEAGGLFDRCMLMLIFIIILRTRKKWFSWKTYT